MLRRLLSAGLVSALMGCMTGSAFAADAGAISQQGPDQWRASKLAGVTIYGPDNRDVGKITDVLMGRDGKAAFVIIGVGGFLGIGEKNVAVPFDQVKFSDQPVTPPPNPAPNNNLAAAAPNNASAAGAAAPAAGGVAANGGIAPNTAVGLGTPADSMGNTAAPGVGGSSGAAAPRSLGYPDHGSIDMTADQLKSAPSFQFAR